MAPHHQLKSWPGSWWGIAVGFEGRRRLHPSAGVGTLTMPLPTAVNQVKSCLPDPTLLQLHGPHSEPRSVQTMAGCVAQEQ